MALQLIQGPPNSGRAGLVRRGLLERLEEDPVLVVPTVDDVYGFERELCGGGALLGAGVMTFTGLFSAVATAGGAPPGAELTRAQRLGAVSAAIAAERRRLGPLRRSAEQPGFAVAFERLLEELQAAGRGPADVEALAGTLEGSAYLGDVAALFAAYARVRDELRTVDRHGIAREAIELLERDGSFWARPVFLYGLDDMTPNQLDLIRALSAGTDVVVAIPHEAGNEALEQRTAPLLGTLEEMGVDSRVETEADPANTDSPLLFHLERGFGAAAPSRREPDTSLLVLRSAGERGEAEAIAAEVASLLSSEVEPEEIAIVLRDPARRGPLLAAVLEGCGIATALEAEVPVATTSVGGTLVALLEAEFGTRRAGDLLRYLRGPSAVSAARVDRFERDLRQRRIEDAPSALELWTAGGAEPPADLARLREAAADPAGLAAEAGSLATAMGARAGGELELRAAGAISNAMAERARLAGLAPEAAGLARSIATLQVRVWTGPVEDRVRIADPRRLRAARFDHVFVASLQEGEFPRGPGAADPFLSERQRASLGLQPRRDTEAEERYLFHACLALPRRRLCLSYRDSDENGAAEAPSPLLDEVRALLAPAPAAGDEAKASDPLAPRTRSRDLATVVHGVAEAPSEGELARAVAAHGRRADRGALLGVAGAEGEVGERLGRRLEAAALAEGATRAPGPVTNPAVIEELGGVYAYGGTTLEGFDECSYRWFVSHELGPQPLDPVPDPLVQGGIMHGVLETLYRERPGGDPLPRPGSLVAWQRRGEQVVAEVAEQRGLGDHPTERAMLRRVEGLLARFLSEEAARDSGGLRPWLLEAGFGEGEDAERAALEIDGWRLHGAIDRVDQQPTAAPWSSTTSSPARSRRARSSRRTPSSSCSST